MGETAGRAPNKRGSLLRRPLFLLQLLLRAALLFFLLLLHVLMCSVVIAAGAVITGWLSVWEGWVRLKVRLWHRSEDAASLTTTRYYRLDRSAQALYKQGALERAEEEANELLHLAEGREKDWNYGNAIHHGHRILGLIALKRGNREVAKRHLLASANTPGSPQLNNFGPSMSLAKALLELGEQAVVLEYLMLCRFFWVEHRSRLDDWSAKVREGCIPNFGGNLR